MTGLWDNPIAPADFEVATAEASGAELRAASFDAALFVDNVNARQNALARAYQERADLIEKMYGVKLENPIVAADEAHHRWNEAHRVNPYTGLVEGEQPLDAKERIYTEKRAAFAEAMARVAAENFDYGHVIGHENDFEARAGAITREAEERLGVAVGSRSDVLAKWGNILAGGFAGNLLDPIQTATMLLGAGPGAARTVAGRILTVAAKEAAISGGTEILLQKEVQNWRRDAGLTHGFDEALGNVLGATAFGAAFGGGFRGLGEGIGASVRAVRRQRAGREIPADVRGAADALEADRAWRESVPEHITEHGDDVAASRALEVAEDPEALARIEGGRIAPSLREEAEFHPDLTSRPRAGSSPEGAEDFVGFDKTFGPVLDPETYRGDWPALVRRLDDIETGIAPEALHHPEIGDIDVVRGAVDPERPGQGLGLARIAAEHPERVADLPESIARAEIDRAGETEGEIALHDRETGTSYRVRKDDDTGRWVLASAGETPARAADVPAARAGRAAEAGAEGGAAVDAGPDGRARVSVDEATRSASDAASASRFEPETDGPAQADLIDAEARRADGEADTAADYADLEIPDLVVDEDGNVKSVMRPLGEVIAEADRGEYLAGVLEACKVI